MDGKLIAYADDAALLIKGLTWELVNKIANKDINTYKLWFDYKQNVNIKI